MGCLLLMSPTSRKNHSRSKKAMDDEQKKSMQIKWYSAQIPHYKKRKLQQEIQVLQAKGASLGIPAFNVSILKQETQVQYNDKDEVGQMEMQKKWYGIQIPHYEAQIQATQQQSKATPPPPQKEQQPQKQQLPQQQQQYQQMQLSMEAALAKNQQLRQQARLFNIPDFNLQYLNLRLQLPTRR